jgi:hypothetical protein
MTETRIDELLDDYVPAFEPRSDGWEDVLARVRTTRRRYAAVAVMALALLLVPTAVALRGQITDLFEGTAPPPAVSGFFKANNKMADMAMQKGFGARFPHADVGKAHGVIEIQTPDGPQDLWVAPNDQGGVCWFIDFANDPAPNGVHPGSGSCDTSETAHPSSGIAFEGPGWDITHPSLYTVDGRVYGDAATVQVAFADGSKITLPVVEGLFLGSLDRPVKMTQVTAYDDAGNQVAQMTRP